MSRLSEDAREIYDLIDVVQSQLHPDYATLSRILQDADRLVHLHQASSEAHFLRGWALYCLWDNGFGDARKALDEMYIVLRYEPLHQWALWFSIVLSSVLKEDDAVVELFARVDRGYFVHDDKDWRYLKAWEYALCSYIRLGRLDVFRVGFMCLIREFVKVADDPEEILERPNQIMAVYRELRSDPRGSVSERDRQMLIDLLEDQLALLVPGGWIRLEELGPASR